jgi:hypothetical protein
LRHVQQSARIAIRLSRVPADLTGVSCDAANDLGGISDAYFAANANIHDFRAAAVIDEGKAGFG